MLRLSKLTDYAIVVLSRLSARADDRRSAAELAQDTGLPEPTVAKVLKALSRSGLVQSTRGASGGYRLTRPLEEISVATVITAMEGPIALTSCVPAATDSCSVEEFCPLRGNWQRVNQAIEVALEAVSVADMLIPAGASMPATIGVNAAPQ